MLVSGGAVSEFAVSDPGPFATATLVNLQPVSLYNQTQGASLSFAQVLLLLANMFSSSKSTPNIAYLLPVKSSLFSTNKIKDTVTYRAMLKSDNFLLSKTATTAYYEGNLFSRIVTISKSSSTSSGKTILSSIVKTVQKNRPSLQFILQISARVVSHATNIEASLGLLLPFLSRVSTNSSARSSAIYNAALHTNTLLLSRIIPNANYGGVLNLVSSLLNISKLSSGISNSTLITSRLSTKSYAKPSPNYIASLHSSIKAESQQFGSVKAITALKALINIQITSSNNPVYHVPLQIASSLKLLCSNFALLTAKTVFISISKHQTTTIAGVQAKTNLNSVVKIISYTKPSSIATTHLAVQATAQLISTIKPNIVFFSFLQTKIQTRAYHHVLFNANALLASYIKSRTKISPAISGTTQLNSIIKTKLTGNIGLSFHIYLQTIAENISTVQSNIRGQSILQSFVKVQNTVQNRLIPTASLQSFIRTNLPTKAGFISGTLLQSIIKLEVQQYAAITSTTALATNIKTQIKTNPRIIGFTQLYASMKQQLASKPSFIPNVPLSSIINTNNSNITQTVHLTYYLLLNAIVRSSISIASVLATQPGPSMRAERDYTRIVPLLTYTLIVPPLMRQGKMPAVIDLPPIGPNQRQTMALDFGRNLPPGVRLTGQPFVRLTVQSGIDPTPQSRLVYGPSIGTAQAQRGGTGIPNTAILFIVQGCLPGVTYLVDAYCPRTDGDTAEYSARFICEPIGSP